MHYGCFSRWHHCSKSVNVLEAWFKITVMLQSGLNIKPVITHRFHYTDFQKGFDAMLSGQCGKVVLDWAT